MEKKTFTVPNIGCNGCVNTIKSELGEIAGVQKVDGVVATKMITVEWDKPATWDTITNKLVEIDYSPAEVS
jgi:copper chaperone CopZ